MYREVYLVRLEFLIFLGSMLKCKEKIIMNIDIKKIEKKYNIDIEKTYQMITKYHDRYLKDKGVVLPGLKQSNGKYLKRGLVLTYLSNNYPDTKEVSKEELTKFIKEFDPNTTDVQDGRHLARQCGWYIDSGKRGDIHANKICNSCYKLRSLERVYPYFEDHRKTTASISDWDKLKEAYDMKCAGCGSEEGKSNNINKNVITELQQGHMNPTLPLEAGNVIPQCQECNRPDRDKYIYDYKGRVIDVTEKELMRKIKKIKSKEMATNIIEHLSKKFK